VEPCIQRENIGSLKEAATQLKFTVERLDKRINGALDKIANHLEESPIYRGEIAILKTEVKNLKEEKNNTTKASQWRVGLIIGVVISLVQIVIAIVK